MSESTTQSTAQREVVGEQQNRDISETSPSQQTQRRDPVRCKVHFNRLLTLANHREAYPVFTTRLSGVEKYFADPDAMHVTADGPQESDSGIELAATHGQAKPSKTLIGRLFSGVQNHLHSSRERQRLREVLSAKLLTQEYNTKPPFIRALFADTPQGRAARKALRAMHRRMYGQGLFKFLKKPRDKYWVQTGDEFLDIIEEHGGKTVKRENAPNEKEADKLARKHVGQIAGPEYTFTLLADGTLHFSRADSNFLDKFSKHAMHSNASESVVYAGTLRVERAEGTMKRVLIMDNDSGTYAPRVDRNELARLRELMEYNFRDLDVKTLKYEFPGSEDSDDSN
ncbi:uncharacterized protein EV422DRAFT_518903 [Fimicolochytrium jonesii]|uniref:uncharacterized protein n=1 Tax=Fimicolochytrium jonesii TaxID=1396493 RepID=UPI0022FF0658|nr:uncharacterized protein EV422DRAFT_518903 [Fimicolochytrium jonesii]KAI8824115.1 hypothetical protein EV422DRAFT_518903 [Fimicolochytrium jonesii]